MERRSFRASRSTTVQDTVAVLGLACVAYLMFASVAASKEPDWPVFWFALAILVLGFFFYGRCACALRDFLEAQHARYGLKDRIGTGAD
jgi:hypothetical protein